MPCEALSREFLTSILRLLCHNEGLLQDLLEYLSFEALWDKREFSNARTPQQNGVTERRNKSLIEAARTMLANAKLPVTFWAEAVNTACYVQNRVLVNKAYNKTPYELFNGRTPAIGFLKPFGCQVMILNTLDNLDNLGKYEAKGDEVCQIVQKKQEEKRIEEEQAASAQYWKIPACCDDDDDYNSTITPVLSTEETENSLGMGDEHLDTIPATESDEVIKSSVEDLAPIQSEFEGIPDTMCDVHLVNNPTPLEAKDHFEISLNSTDDISSSDDDSLYKENIEYVEASPHDSKVSSSTSPKSFLEETNTFHNSLPEFENFYFDLEEISSGSTTTHSNISLSDYEAFYFNDDHIKEISSGSTTTRSNISLSEYDSFIFDLSKDQFPPTDWSDFTHEEFADELAHITSLPKYDCFYFRNLPDRGELISILNSEIRENPPSTTLVNLPVEDDYSPLLTYVVWIFLTYLT
nr:ribonuclease H-like domain-containing protein [Tanacetum cinerariifolium]